MAKRPQGAHKLLLRFHGGASSCPGACVWAVVKAVQLQMYCSSVRQQSALDCTVSRQHCAACSNALAAQCSYEDGKELR